MNTPFRKSLTADLLCAVPCSTSLTSTGAGIILNDQPDTRSRIPDNVSKYNNIIKLLVHDSLTYQMCQHFILHNLHYPN